MMHGPIQIKSTHIYLQSNMHLFGGRIRKPQAKIHWEI